MKCGQEVQVTDAWGAIAAVAVSQCGGTFRVIVYSTDWRDRADAPFRNGEILYAWPALLDRLVWLIAHPPEENAAMAYMARTSGERYAQVLLAKPVPSTPVLGTQLAAVLEADPAEVRARLHDYLAVPEPVGESEGDHADAGDPPPALG